MIRLLASGVVGGCIVGGQMCLAAFARALAPPFTIANLASQAFAMPWLYLAGAAYSVAVLLYLILLRTGAISATNLPIMAVIVVLNIAIALSPGDALTARQITGAVLVGAGTLLMLN
ncbi:MAG TPA: hypothetical protein PK812_01535 [Beijerinckiaceae bacterium]|nr:hypothetical protein [Beijerinckiaceae bacterium]